jgi:protein involved in polysaccharide export with SLBB domain
MRTKRLLLVAALLGAFASQTNHAAEPATPTTAKPPRAAWQESFKLGPGDVVSVMIYGMPDSARTDIPVGPDGRLTYMQAQDVMAAGLSVDELRAALEKELGKYFRAPRTIVTPTAYNSKKYVVLGAVANKGVFTFNRPMTVLEAIANAGGLETSVNQRTTGLGMSEQFAVDRADLSHSMLLRQGVPVPIDLERLFQQGDLKQNAAIEPGDVLYFPSTKLSEIYVLGEVVMPGVEPFQTKATVIKAITARGGFMEKAYKQHVLVIRGSLNKPELFVVDTKDILFGKTTDFVLQPRDIIYVSNKPWAKAEDLFDTALRSFIQAMVVSTASVHVGPWITTPIGGR